MEFRRNDHKTVRLSRLGVRSEVLFASPSTRVFNACNSSTRLLAQRHEFRELASPFAATNPNLNNEYSSPIIDSVAYETANV